MLSEEEKKAIEQLNKLTTTKFNNDYSIDSEDKKAIETLLNMIKENSAEIQQKNAELAEKNAEIEKKDKQIDLMAEEIEKGDIEFTEYCNFKIVCDRNCKGCIVKYFERKATNNG